MADTSGPTLKTFCSSTNLLFILTHDIHFDSLDNGWRMIILGHTEVVARILRTKVSQLKLRTLDLGLANPVSQVDCPAIRPSPGDYGLGFT